MFGFLKNKLFGKVDEISKDIEKNGKDVEIIQKELDEKPGFFSKVKSFLFSKDENKEKSENIPEERPEPKNKSKKASESKENSESEDKTEDKEIGRAHV